MAEDFYYWHKNNYFVSKFIKTNVMTLIKSISGIRGTIGGNAGDNLTPQDLVKFTAAYVEWQKREE